MCKCMELTDWNDVTKVLVVGMLCSLEDVKLSCILTGLIEALHIDQETIHPQPFCTLVAKRLHDKLQLTYIVS